MTFEIRHMQMLYPDKQGILKVVPFSTERSVRRVQDTFYSLYRVDPCGISLWCMDSYNYQHTCEAGEFFRSTEGKEPNDILRELLKQHNQRAIDFRTVSRWARAARDLGHHGERQLRALEMFANVVLYTEAKGTW